MRLHEAGRLRVLDFDCESRPLSYLGQDFTTAEVTAVACSWIGEKDVRVWLLGVDDAEPMLRGFKELYDLAGMVTGHNIRRHDLPRLNGALIEAGLPTLGPKLTQDTYGDLVRRDGISASQASLGEMFGTSAPKVGMSQPKWREANRLTPDGIEATRKRVVGDVVQHKQLRQKLLEAGLLRAPRVWTP